MKLFTIGDSISQGFMSLAAARTELSFSTLLARSLGMVPGTDDYPIPTWGAGGLPLNIESLMRTLQRRFGSDVRGPLEWPLALSAINDFLDDVEDYYERGAGNIALPQAGRRQFFPNVAIAGFTVADAWIVKPSWCVQKIAQDTKGDEDGFFALPNCRFQRTAHAVLNPSRDLALNDRSQLEWLRHHVQNGGVENLILWLGSNNALGTIVRMRVMSTKDAQTPPHKMTYEQRDQYNLWTEEHFRLEFEALMEQVHAILNAGPSPCKVFVGTVPPVTVAPLARGVGGTRLMKDPFGVLQNGALYFDRYTYFLFDQDYARRSSNSLSLEEIYDIDTTISKYNKAIKNLVTSYNGQNSPNAKYFVVDIADQLLRLAFKRNNGKPTYQLPPDLQAYVNKGRPVNTVYYTVDRKGRMTAGGVFSLDGVHPSAIGHGLIAYEFLNAMKAQGVKKADGSDLDNLHWDSIIASDSLYTNPISLMPELYDNTRIAEMVLDLLRLP